MPWSFNYGPSFIHMSVSNFSHFMAYILKVSNFYLLPNSKLDSAETWWKASRQHRDLELLKWFRSDIKDGQHDIHL